MAQDCHLRTLASRALSPLRWSTTSLRLSCRTHCLRKSAGCSNQVAFLRAWIAVEALECACLPFSTQGKKRLLIVLRERPDRHSQWSSDSLFPASDSHQVSGFIQAIHQHVEINKSAVRLPCLRIR